jgi:mannose-6-phosphate isomerase
VDDAVLSLTRGQSVDIPFGSKHRLENLGTEQVDIIEVQFGDYLGEDDIIRYDDIYNRS